MADDLRGALRFMQRYRELEELETWRALAACAGYPLEWFYGEMQRPGSKNVRRARAICATCPVRLPCLTTALLEGRADGIWAGTTPIEREATEDRALEERVAVLTEQFRQQATHGPWRVVSEAEWEEAARVPA